ncbi:hypothetical protein KGF54_005274 [Candida jiufengensis]|uniref:uncharacterized protein n=1 Tax=Candida jiufengensis TaxID=497108 RepID=UPI0022258A1A|nr:uncharacterized protein KGF54_005274 [Candida jiufengensis]KAI5950126.1 hypothetical protein KGF54_005274 [Candida jiufengensis]
MCFHQSTKKNNIKNFFTKPFKNHSTKKSIKKIHQLISEMDPESLEKLQQDLTRITVLHNNQLFDAGCISPVTIIRDELSETGIYARPFNSQQQQKLELDDNHGLVTNVLEDGVAIKDLEIIAYKNDFAPGFGKEEDRGIADLAPDTNRERAIEIDENGETIIFMVNDQVEKVAKIDFENEDDLESLVNNSDYEAYIGNFRSTNYLPRRRKNKSNKSTNEIKSNKTEADSKWNCYNLNEIVSDEVIFSPTSNNSNNDENKIVPHNKSSSALPNEEDNNFVVVNTKDYQVKDYGTVLVKKRRNGFNAAQTLELFDDVCKVGSSKNLEQNNSSTDETADDNNQLNEDEGNENASFINDHLITSSDQNQERLFDELNNQLKISSKRTKFFKFLRI